MLARRCCLKTLIAAVGVCAIVALPAFAADVVVLDTNGMWRFHETWQTDVARLDDGRLIRINPYKPRQALVYKDQSVQAGKYSLRPAKVIRGSALPPNDWRDAKFDDSDWNRQTAPFLGYSYRSLALLSVRGKFAVRDPAKAGDLSLSIVFQGGVVAYLNGKEIGRAHLGAGKIDPFTLAGDYPRETFVATGGKLIAQHWYMGNGNVARWRIPKDLYNEWVAGYKKRGRKLTVKIPASFLRKGTNVLAFEIHRAPGIELMFAKVTRAGSFDRNIRKTHWWNRAAVESIRLTAPAGATGVASNVKPPKRLHVWNHVIFHRVDPKTWGDPLEPLRPIRLIGVRNGVFSGNVVVSCAEPLANLKAKVSQLKGPAGARIPAASVKVRYPRYERWSRNFAQFDALDRTPQMNEKRPRNTQPVWVTVSVPKDARPGNYTGGLTVTVEGAKAVEVPIALEVVDWTLPDPVDFTTHVGIIQSPESVALQYNVAMWSEVHWKLLDRSFELMAKAGAKTIYIPVKCRTHFGNPHSMVRWVKQADGSHKHDFTIVERYLDTAVRHLGKVPIVCLAIYDGGPSNTRPDAPGTFVTERDPATGKLTEIEAPDWGTPESRAFWKPVLDRMRTILAKRGLEKSMMVGLAQSVRYQAVADLKAIAPDAKWVAHSHLYNEQFGKRYRTAGQPVGYLAQVGGMYSVYWDPDGGRPFYGWRNPFRVVTYPRDDSGAGVGPRLRPSSELVVYRLAAEGAILSGRQDRYPAKWGARVESLALKHKKKFPGVRGFGRLGADFWRVLKGKRGSQPICGRYPGSDWGTLNVKHVCPYLFAPGPEGAISTVRFEMMRESLQEAEARIFVQDAVLDDDTRAKLGKPLAERAGKLMDERTRALRYISEYQQRANGRHLLTAAWNHASRKLYRTAAEVAKKLKTN